MSYLMGVDLGSSVLKTTLMDEESGFNATRTIPYDQDWIGEKPDYLERDVDVYWLAFKKAVQGFLQHDQIDPTEIKAISFSVQGETFVPLNKDFKPLRKTLQGHDVRARQEIQLLRDRFGDAALYPVSGQPMIDGYWPAVKILWIKRHQPQVFAQARYYAMLEDYFIYKLTGRLVSDKSLVADSYYYDMTRQSWYLPMLDFLDLQPEMLPDIADPCQPVGTLTSTAAGETGLSPQTTMVAGAMDQIAGAVGAGNVLPGIITETTGTSLAIGVTAPGKLEDYLRTGLPIYFHAVKDTYFLMPWLAGGGLTFQWFARNLSENGTEDYDRLTALAATIPPGAEGLIMLPFLLGATCPEFDSSAKGVFFGITASHTRPHFIRSVLEAVGYAIRSNLDLVKSVKIPVTAIRSLGGGSKSRLWNQIKADICGIPVSSMDIQDASSLGAALMAGVGVGAYPSIQSAGKSRFIRVKETFTPNSKNQETYDAGYRKYRAIYQHLKGVF